MKSQPAAKKMTDYMERPRVDSNHHRSLNSGLALPTTNWVASYITPRGLIPIPTNSDTKQQERGRHGKRIIFFYTHKAQLMTEIKIQPTNECGSELPSENLNGWHKKGAASEKLPPDSRTSSGGFGRPSLPEFSVASCITPPGLIPVHTQLNERSKDVTNEAQIQRTSTLPVSFLETQLVGGGYIILAWSTG
ncbi:hypothetical protein C8R44DRAFT_725271 [Mycena epipterygia]|nr:hypothetical protein C8R44DRAFT_725271 [Mycena epipterygia]